MTLPLGQARIPALVMALVISLMAMALLSGSSHALSEFPDASRSDVSADAVR